MNYYPHHIGDFNNETRHLTRVERSLYRDLIEMYLYEERKPQSKDFDKLARKLMANSDEERSALRDVLNEFFYDDGEGYYHAKCDDILTSYHTQQEKQSLAGKASGEARRKKRESNHVEQSSNARSTPVQQVCNQPITNNQEPITKEKTLAEGDKSPPASGFVVLSASGFVIPDALVAKWKQAFPAVDVPQEVAKAEAWILANPKNKKSNYARFLNSWLTRSQDSAPRVAAKPKLSVHDRANLDYEKRYGTPESVAALAAKLTRAA